MRRTRRSPAIAAANTVSSFDAALEHGADMIEFDVRSWQGRLVVAHYPWQPGLSAVPTLDDALTHLATPRFAGLELNVDIKHLGVEAALLDALVRHGLERRTLVSVDALYGRGHFDELKRAARLFELYAKALGELSVAAAKPRRRARKSRAETVMKSG